MMRKSKSRVILALTLLVGGTGTALADPFEWAYGMNGTQAANKLSEQGFVFDRQAENQGRKAVFYWHRRAFCVKFMSVDDVVSDAIAVPTSECRSEEHGYGRRIDRNAAVPNWMIGYFEGYNAGDVSLDIHPNGRVVAEVNGTRVDGQIRDGKMQAGLFEFYLHPTRDGLTTIQVGNDRNQVHYRRR